MFHCPASSDIRKPGRQSSLRLLLAAALLLICLTLAAPVAAEDPVTVTTFSDLNNALAGTAPVIIIGADIDVTQTLSITREVTITTDGQPRTLLLGTPSDWFFMIHVTTGGNLTLIGNGNDGSLTLNGNKETYSNTNVYRTVLNVQNGGNVTINDGVIITNMASSNCPAIVTYGNGHVTMNGGKITGHTTLRDEAAVRLDDYGTIFTMNGGEISGTIGGSGVCLIRGNPLFIMNGGTISGNDASGNGGGIYVPTGRISMTGGTISGNTANGKGNGIYFAGSPESLSISGSAVVDADNDIYLGSGKFIIVPDVFTGSVNSITGDADVLTPGYKMVQTQNSVQASDILGKFHPGDPTRYLTTNTENNALTLDPSRMPATASASAVVRNSTIADISFTLVGGPDTIGAIGARVSLTDTGGSVISETIARSISPGETVSGIQFTGLTPGVPYRLTITLQNGVTAGTPRVYTHPSPVITPVIDRIDIFDGNGNVSGTTMDMVSGDRVACTAKIWNGSSEIANEPVSWTATGANISLTTTTGTATTVTAVQGGTGTITASLSSGSTSSSFSVLIFNDLPDTLTLTANVTNYDVDQSVNLTANLTNSTSGSRYDNIAVSITNTGSPIVSGLTGSPITWTSVPEGTHTLTANVTIWGSDVLSSPLTLTLPLPMPEVTTASAVAWNSTAANISFTLAGGPDTIGATGARINLTDTGGSVITENITRPISAGDTVSGIQIAGLVPGTGYQLTITPLNESAYGTPRVYTHSDLLTPPVIDRIDIYNGITNISDTAIYLKTGIPQTYTAKAWNATTQIVNESVTWSSSDPAVITLTTGTGRETTLTPLSPGTAVITGTTGMASSSTTVRVFDAADIPDTLTLTANLTTLTLGRDTTEFTTTLTNSTSTTEYKDIPVTIKNDTGTIIASGVTGRTPFSWAPQATGTYTFTANVTLWDTEINSDPLLITVTKSITSLSLANGPAATTNDTATGTFTATITYSDGGSSSDVTLITWSSSDNDTLGIDATGNWQAKKSGTAEITATAGSITKTTGAITIEATPAEITLSGIDTSVIHFANGTLTAVVKDKNGVEITADSTLDWISDPVGNFTFSNPSGSTVTWNATKTGPAAIKLNATAGGVSTESLPTRVTVTKTITSLSLANGPASTTNDTATGTFTVAITYSDGTTGSDVTLITWTSSDNDTLGVDTTGNWQAKKSGTAEITATVTGTAISTATGLITVQVTPALIEISGIPASLRQDQTGTASAVVKDKTGTVITTPVTWTTNNSSVITIDTTSGAWTAIAKGTANISASATSGGTTKQQNITLGVVNIPKTVEISGIPADIRRGDTAQLTAILKDTDGAIIAPDTTVWTSHNTDIFTVAPDGTFTAVAPGTANISVSATALETTVTNETPISVKSDAGITIDEPLPGSEHKAGTPVQFNTTTTGLDTITGYLWTLGDGNTASGRNITHTYDELTGLGPKTINITVTYAGSKTVSREISITLIKNDSRAASVEINTAPEYIYPGKTGTLGAAVKDQYGAKMETGATVQWTSNDTGVLSISGDTWTSHSAGFAKITATVAENTSAAASREVEVVALPAAATVVITGTPDKISIGTAATLTALVLDLNSVVMPAETVDWTSSNTAAVTVAADGTIRAVGAGTATITATAKSSPPVTADVSVSVVPDSFVPVLTTLKITGSVENLYENDPFPLGILALDQDGAVYTPLPSVTWTSGDEGVLTVADGTVTAVGAGTTTITAAAAGGITDQVTITVSAIPRPATQTLTSIAVTPASVTLYPQKTAGVAAAALDENRILFTNETVTWTWASDNEAAATVSGTGTITAHAAGSATITATARTDSGTEKSETVTITVETPPSGPDQTPSSVKISGSGSMAALEETGGTLKAVVLNRDGVLLPAETVTWSSSSETTVIIDASTGVYRAKSTGSATLTASSVTDTSKSASITFTVKKNPDLRTPSGITISVPSSLTVGQTASASAVVTDQYGTALIGETVLWSSDAAGIADVSSSGMITAKSAGMASITATVFGYESVNASQMITVTNKPGPVPTITPTSSGSSGDGYSGTVSVSVSGTGSVDFGLSHGITGVSFAKGTTGTVILDTKPTGVTGPTRMHSVVEITAPSFAGAAEISFSVPVAVLRDQGLSVNDVVMQHYVNGQWVKLPTFFVGEDRGAAKYVAQTTSFSPFAIVYESGGAQMVERSTPQPTKDAGSPAATAKPTSGTTSATAVPTTSAATGGATAVPTMTQASVPVAGMLAGLFAAAGVLIRRRE